MSVTSLPSPERRLSALFSYRISARTAFFAIAALHGIAIAVLLRTEIGVFPFTLALASWAMLNCLWLTVVDRPGTAAALSLAMILVLITVSLFKFDVIWMTASFLDVLIIDPDTIAFLFKIFPDMRGAVAASLLIGVPLLFVIWRLDPFRVRRRVASLGAAASFAIVAAMSLAVPEQPSEPFQGINHVSGFFRSGILAGSELARQGWLESSPGHYGARASEPLGAAASETCKPAGPRPNIIMVLDESSFDASVGPGIKLPPDYTRHFQSFDGRIRQFEVEGTGGPTWYTEYNVLTGLSARSFGKLMFYVTRIAAGRVERGLPNALRRCGYKTVSLYPTQGAFLSARRFQASAGMHRMIDGDEMGAGDVDPDHFFYNQALRVIERESADTPLFIFVYTVANHFPWDDPYRPDLTPGWTPPGNTAEIDEYLRRQTMSARDYRDFTERLRQKFPDRSFLLARFGDHQPYISPKMIDPGAPQADVARSIEARDPRYFTTYYALDTVNFKPVDVSSALPKLDAPYLPLVVLEAAGLPLEPSFAEQKSILQRCRGIFYGCRDGAEARRFNRLLIDAGLIKGL